jgi:alpha-beta hydrolase superfamily lysophospholipase
MPQIEPFFSRYTIRRLLYCGLFLLNTGCAPLVRLPGPAVAPARLALAHFETTDRAVLPVRTWLSQQQPTKAVLIALHGFNDYSYFFNDAGRFLGSQGIACYAYDQRGFGNAPGRGLWWGTEAYIRDLRDFTAEVRQRHPGLPVYILGESMGGAIAITALTNPNPPRADGVILSAPAVWSRDTMPWYQRWLLAATAHTAPWLTLTGEGLHILPTDNLPVLRGMSRDPRVIKATRIDAMHGLSDLMDRAAEQARYLPLPVLLPYGKHDQVIPAAALSRMLSAMKERTGLMRVALYEQGYHMLLRDMHAEQPWRDIARWMDDPRAPLPSAADQVPLGTIGQAEIPDRSIH